jgi:hypothetical protein
MTGTHGTGTFFSINTGFPKSMSLQLMMTCRLREIFIVKCPKQAFSFNKTKGSKSVLLCISACFEERYMHKT